MYTHQPTNTITLHPLTHSQCSGQKPYSVQAVELTTMTTTFIESLPFAPAEKERIKCGIQTTTMGKKQQPLSWMCSFALSTRNKHSEQKLESERKGHKTRMAQQIHITSAIKSNP